MYGYLRPARPFVPPLNNKNKAHPPHQKYPPPSYSPSALPFPPPPHPPSASLLETSPSLSHALSSPPSGTRRAKHVPHPPPPIPCLPTPILPPPPRMSHLFNPTLRFKLQTTNFTHPMSVRLPHRLIHLSRSQVMMNSLAYSGLLRPLSSHVLLLRSSFKPSCPCDSELLPLSSSLDNPLYFLHALLSHYTTMRCRSRDPCTCPTYGLEDMRDQFQGLYIEYRHMEDRLDSRHKELQ
jgi:hypothetical protein